MEIAGKFDYSDEGDFQMIKVPYAVRNLSMLVFLPKQRDGLGDFEQNLTGERLDGSITSLKSKMVHIRMPKFTFRSSIQMMPVLKQMGLGHVFSDAPDFSRMTDAPLKVSKVIHEAYINVNENSTEAAAVTAVISFLRTGPGKPVKPIPFVADHPYMFAIQHDPSKAILFMGKVNFVENQ